MAIFNYHHNSMSSRIFYRPFKPEETGAGILDKENIMPKTTSRTKNAAQKPIITVFAGSAMPSDPKIREAARMLGEKIGAGGYDLIYGAGTQGLMGIVAKAAQDAGAHVTAVILKKYEHEKQLDNISRICVNTEQERFIELITHRQPVAHFALPGGAGTLREIMQSAERGVYEDGPPVILVEVGGYLDGIKDAFNRAVAGGLIRKEKCDKIKSWRPSMPLADVLPPAAPAAVKKIINIRKP